ncbi:MAG: adenosine deaminase [Bacteroidetes bacterium]|nr:adenosine deaminase [Bacteroidota bacterium]
MISESLEKYISNIPKTELHLHIEGSFEPELMFEIARRNNINIRFKTVEELRKAYQFGNLQDFLDIYYDGANVLIHEQDFYDLTMAYFRKCKENNVVHTEIFADPQTHLSRGVKMETIINGITRAREDAERELGISSYLIICFLRHLDEDSAIETLEEALNYKNEIIGVGLDSSEVGNHPEKFKRVFARAKEEDFRLVAHAGEEGPSEYIWGALRELNVSRIDHGIRCMNDEGLIDYLAENQVPLTVCPLSNLKLQVVKNLSHHPLKEMLNNGLLAMINSDDPAYFGGYVNENFLQTAEALNLSEEDILQLAKNSFKASFLPE